MGDVINLNKARKVRRRVQARTEAAANRVKHGRTAAEKALDQSRAGRLDRSLDQARRETGPGDAEPEED